MSEADKTALVTGAGRGIGLELCRQLRAMGYEVVACPRAAGSEELERLAAEGGLTIVPMDVADADSVAAAAAQIEQRVQSIDLLFNNGAIYPKSDGGIHELPFENLARAFDVNSIGPLRHEAKEKLSRVRPRDLAQASRISGITPADMALLMVHLDAPTRSPSAPRRQGD